jgi:6-phosphogluconolactonase
VLKDGRLGEATSFVQHKGSSVNPQRQEGPHAHAIALSPDNRFAVVADLGLDELLVYSFDSAKGTLGANPQVAKASPGAGPRHLAFSSDGRFLYVINELQSTVVTYSYNTTTGSLHELQTISTLPKHSAAITRRPKSKFILRENFYLLRIAEMTASQCLRSILPRAR